MPPRPPSRTLIPAPERAPPAGRARFGPSSAASAHNPTAQSTGTTPMTTATWITMIVIMAFVWGGLALALRTAIRKESAKSADN